MKRFFFFIIVVAHAAMCSCTNLRVDDVADIFFLDVKIISSTEDALRCTVTSLEKWDVTSMPTWVKMLIIKQYGDSQYEWTVDFSIAANNGYDREGIIVFETETERVGIPVIQKGAKGIQAQVQSITLSKTLLSLHVGDYSSIVATILPANAYDREIYWCSSDESVAVFVIIDGARFVWAVGEGEATITASSGGKSASCRVLVHNKPVHDAVNLGLSVKWATCNVGATKPEEYGEYFAWGETQSKTNYTWPTYMFRASGNTDNGVKFNKYNYNYSYGTVDNMTVLDLEDDAAFVNWGGSWRMPTDEEWTELRTVCTWSLITQNGVDGMLVTGPNGKSIFLPAAGCWGGTDLDGAGSYGRYWSSSLSSEYPNRARNVYFFNEVGRGSGQRYIGLSVRPVSE